MLRIAVGSRSGRIYRAVRDTAAYWLGEVDVRGFQPTQEVIQKELRYTACFRAECALLAWKECDLAIAVMSGTVERYGQTYEETWCQALARDEREGCGYSSGLLVPKTVLDRMYASGQSYEDVMEALREEQVQATKETWGLFTQGRLLRERALEEAVRNALMPFCAPEMYLPVKE